MNSFRQALILVAISTFFSACKKENETSFKVPPPPPTEPTAFLSATRTINYSVSPPLHRNSAQAWFHVDPFLVQAGTVQVNDLQLNWHNIFHVTPTGTTGIFDDGNVHWSVSGGNGYPAMEHDVIGEFPQLGDISSDDLIFKSEGYTLSTSMAVDADSIRFSIGTQPSLARMLPGNATSYTYTPDELDELTAGNEYWIVIKAFRYEDFTIEGRRIRFTRECQISDWFIVED